MSARRHSLFWCSVLCGLLAVTQARIASAQDWVTYSNQTSVRLPTNLNDPSLSTNDPEEKDYAWGDIDQDGDIDLVVVRKSPFTSIGRRRNVLFMNEGIADGRDMNGVLVDRTSEYIPGFLDLTDDRDVALADVDGDGWLDIITAVTYGSGQPTSISHPRVYINQGEIAGEWQGYVYEQARIPTFPGAPNFCGVAAGDVTGDGMPDLYFTDYDRLGQTSPFEDRLLINDGFGVFSDQSTQRMSISMLASDFGINAVIQDMNGDGWNDIVKNENGPVKTFNNAGNGFFDLMETTYGGAAYFFNTGFIDEPVGTPNPRPDIVISDDGTDVWMRNLGNGANGMADYTNIGLPGTTGGFGSNSLVVDLDNDGWNDVLIADVDVDASGCTRISDILRNNGNPPNNTFTPGSAAAGIPDSLLQGVHDIAVFDVNNDGWQDIVFGRCSGTQVWINAPPVTVAFDYTDLPGEFITPDADRHFQVQLNAIGDTLDPDSPEIHVSVNKGAFETYPLSLIGDGEYEVVVPASECLDNVRFYLSAMVEGGLLFKDPPSAPLVAYTTTAANGMEIALASEFEADVSEWTVINEPELTAGGWEQADPNGTLQGPNFASPDNDATPDGTMAFVTENGPPGGNAADNDVDGGATFLVSPVMDFAGTDGIVTYKRWHFSTLGTPDRLLTEVTGNGVDWLLVDGSPGTGGQWQAHSFRISDFVETTSTVQVRFWTGDPDVSVTESGIDDLTIERFVCEAQGCVADLNADSGVDAADLALLLGAWGPNPGNIADLNQDGTVDAADLALLLGSWGPC